MSEPKTVTIKLPSGALGGWPVLVDALRRAKEATGYDMVFGGLIEQIEAQTPPRKPTEPTGLGAVVECDPGPVYTWARAVLCRPGSPRAWEWSDSSGNGGPARWGDLKAVRMLSEGVTE